MERFKQLTLEQIYERFDIAHIRKLIEYSDNKNPINLDNISKHQPLFEMIPDDDSPLLTDDNPIDYKAKVELLEAQLEADRNRRVDGNQWVVAKTDDKNETVEVPTNLLKQIMNVLNNNKK